MATKIYTRNRFPLHCLLLFFFILFSVSSAQAASRFYFTGLVEMNAQTEKPDILLNWGSLEGDLPEEIESFNLYRKTDSGPFVHLAEIPYRINSSLGQFISDDWNTRRFTEVIDLLNDINTSSSSPGPEITSSNFENYLGKILDEGSPTHNPVQKWLLGRFNHNISRGMGLGYLDRDISAENQYTYMLTALTAGGESLPIGQTGIINPAIATVLPPPDQFRQVLVGECSLYQKNLDDLRIHFTWQLPSMPQEIGLNILTYGYTLYWSEEEINPVIVNLNIALPEGLVPMSPKPVVVAGPPEEKGSNNFLSRDDGTSHVTGPAWKRGQHYFYYIARRDIAGNFSSLQAVTDNPVAVVDAQPPVTPWRVHTEEAMSPLVAGTSEPQLHLVWDQINPVNYVRYFGVDRAICSVNDTQVCMASSEENCANNKAVRCVDTNVVTYDIYRFPSEAEAASWGIDSDGDLWPDTIENAVASDPCDATVFPTDEAPSQKIISIDQNDLTYQRNLNDKHIQMLFIDPQLNPAVYDEVFFYKIIARDSAGNQSPVSPPIRAILHNREQPAAAGTLYVEKCDNHAAIHDSTDATYMEQGDLLTLVDLTGEAVRWTLSAHCPIGTQTGFNIIELASGSMIDSKAHITADMIDSMYCDTLPCDGTSYVITFYDKYNLSLVSPPPSRTLGDAGFFSVIDLCTSFNGTVTLDAFCSWSQVTTPNRVAGGEVKICAPLAEGQVGRVYQKINNAMSPVGNIDYNDGDSCVVYTEGPGIVTSDLCLGVRIFSENHIGSAMHYLHCLEMEQSGGDAIPPAPILEGMYSKETVEGEPYFDLHWTGLLEGQASFVIAMTDGQQSRYKTIFPSAKNSSGQFSYQFPLSTEDLSREWCVKARLISTDMKQSPWSEEICRSWEPVEPENVSWPAMDERLEQGEVTAVLLKEGSTTLARRPAIILSKDLSQLMSITLCGGQLCIDALQECDGSAICVERIVDSETGDIYEEPALFENKEMCSYLQPLIKIKHFIIYRQEEGKDFLQVSPLIPGFSCQSYSEYTPPLTGGGPGTWHFYSKIRDPFYSFRKLTSTAIIGQTHDGGAIDPAVATGPRMFYLDHYPAKAGMTVRYKLILLDPATGEPKTELTSNWLTLE